MMLTKIRNISFIVLIAGAIAACHGIGQKPYQEPYRLSGHKPHPGLMGGTVKVAFLLPLSGQYSQLGKAMQDAAQLALFDANLPNLELIPIDTESTTVTASDATANAINNGARLILGPVFSATTEKILPVAAQNNINVISLSNDPSLAGKRGVFLLGYTPQQQIKRVTQYAASRGIKDFAALAPNNAYGVTVINEYQKAIAENQGILHKTAYYTPNTIQPGLQQQVESVLASLPGNTSAVLIPEGGNMLVTLAPRLAAGKNGIPVQLLGSSQWDDATLLQTAGITGGWFAGVDPALHKAFSRRFQDNYGYKPPRIASLAYDAVALAAGVTAQGGGNFSHASLTSPRGFSGAEGIFRLLPNGVSDRGLAILQANGNTITVIDPAPNRFVNF